VEPDPSSLVPISTLPPHLLTLVSNLLRPAGQDARNTKLPVSPSLSSPHNNSPPCRSRSRDQTGQLAPGTPPPFTMLESNFLAMTGARLSPRNSGPPQVRMKTWAQHAAVATLGSRSSSSLKCVAVSTLPYNMPNNPPQVQDALPLSSFSP
jgi:hypothetical protein